MDIYLFEIFCRVSLGVATFGILLVGLGLVLRATTRQEDEFVKWDFLRAVGDADKLERCPRLRDERIQNENDKTQRGDAS